MQVPYQIAEWDSYAESHLSVLPSIQLEVYKSVAEHMHGRVADFGCGTARITPFLADKSDVKSYIGVDYAADMAQKAQWLIAQLSNKNFKVLHHKIEETPLQTFDSALSINSYYTWPDPLLVLKHIQQLLAPNAAFLLVTPNKQLNMQQLAQEADKELLGHPHYPAFRQKNLALAGNEKALFVDMDELVEQLKAAQFKLIACHQHFYLGGLNFVHVVKA